LDSNAEPGVTPDPYDLAARVLDRYGTPEQIADAEDCHPAEVAQIRTHAGLDPQTGDELAPPDEISYDVLDDGPEWERGVTPTPSEPAAKKDDGAAEDRILNRADELEGPGVSRYEAIQSARAELEREDREARYQATRQASAPTDARTLNRQLMKEQGPALDVGGTRGPAAKAPPDRGFQWESEEQPPPYAVEAEEAGVDAYSPVTYYAERDRDDFDSTRSMPYLLKKADGTQEWRRIGAALRPIREALSASRPLDEWQVALRRGRRSAEVSARRGELAPLIAHLVDVQGAQAKAVAKVLDRGRDAVHALLREGRAKSDT
jgi:hypothetical protein